MNLQWPENFADNDVRRQSPQIAMNIKADRQS
jgi:hypothetical protein